MTTLRILSTMGLHGMMQAFEADYEAAHGVAFDAEFLPTVRLMERIRAGGRGDVAILTAEGIEALGAEGVLERRTDLARSFVGVAVKAGAPHPDIGTADAFVAALLAARSVAMSKAGVSGIYMAGLLERLGIAEQVNAKATILASGYTASLAASGEVELAIQQVSELMVVGGVDIVGRLPASLGGETVFSAALFRSGPNETAGRNLIAALRDPALDALYRRCGLEPIGVAGEMQA